MQSPDGRTIRYLTRLPVDAPTLGAQVRHALGLGLPELRDFEYPWAESLTIVANGPSALDAPLDGKTATVNGALRLFTRKGLAPTYWVGCDPQEKLVDFLADAPEETIYLVASKCHPAVFERLRDRKVVLWHVGDLETLHLVADRAPVTPVVSVTGCCFEVFARLGWRRFSAWGWDCCVLGRAENAVAQDNMIEQGAVWLDVQSGEQGFRTTSTWLQEAEDAVSMLKGFPFPVTFHGAGMLGAYARDRLPMKVRLEE